MSTVPIVPERPLQPGDEAPNFDLASTEDVVLMLCDEVPRTAVVLYFFQDAQDARVLADLDALGGAAPRLAARDAKVLAVSSAPLPALKALQAARRLPYPLLHDDRGFLKSYGVEPAAAGQPAPLALCLVDRRQRLRLIQNPAPPVADSLPEIEKLVKGLAPPTSLYPRRVINRWIARWVG